MAKHIRIGHAGSLTQLRIAARQRARVSISVNEYGMTGHDCNALEIDHIVSLELGGPNDIANLFSEKLDANPGYHVKDKLEPSPQSWLFDGSKSDGGLPAHVAGDRNGRMKFSSTGSTRKPLGPIELDRAGKHGRVSVDVVRPR